MTVPSLIYVLQNNLLYVSASNLDAATYQVTYQLKILTTAMFAVTMLKKKLFSTQWGSLLILVCGVAMVQLSQGGENRVLAVEQNRTLGFAAALGACVLSGFAGIFFEKMLKTSDLSVWMRNIQLSLLSLPLSLITSFLNDGQAINEKGFFYGYDSFIYFLVLLQACGGLIVAVVVKYADNILKGFATSLAIVLSCIVSIYLFNFELTMQFSLGTVFVIVSVFLYGHDPNKHKSTKKVSSHPSREDEEKLLGGGGGGEPQNV
jgi:UDP-sugar transporter A1/2/3